MSVGLDRSNLTATERRILDVLFDGLVHTKEDLIDRCLDEMCDVSNLYPHISSLRNKISSSGLLISCLSNGQGPGYLLCRRIYRGE